MQVNKYILNNYIFIYKTHNVLFVVLHIYTHILHNEPKKKLCIYFKKRWPAFMIQ